MQANTPQYFQQHKPLSFYQLNSEILSVRVLGDRVYSCTITHLSVWNRQNYEHIFSIPTSSAFLSVIQRNDKVYLISGSYNGKVTVYQDKGAALEKVGETFDHHTEAGDVSKTWLNAIAVDNDYIYTAGFDRVIRIWKWDDKCQLFETSIEEGAPVTALFVENRIIYYGLANGAVKKSQWNGREFVLDKVSIQSHNGDNVDCITVKDGQVFSASFGCIKIGGLDKRPPLELDSTEASEIGFVTEISVHKDFFCTSSYNGTVRLYKITNSKSNNNNNNNDKTIEKFQHLRAPDSHPIRSVFLHEQDRDITIYGALINGTIQTWIKFKLEFTVVLTDDLGSNALCQDETNVYCARTDGGVLICNKKDRTLRTIATETDIRCLFVSDGRLYIAYGSDWSVYEVKTGKQIMIRPKLDDNPRILTLWVDEGRIYAGCTDLMIAVWNKETGKFKGKFQCKDTNPAPLNNNRAEVGAVHDIVVFRDKIYAAAQNRIFCFSKLTFQLACRVLEGHQGSVTKLCWYYDPTFGRHSLYSCSDIGEIILWRSFEDIQKLEPGADTVLQVTEIKEPIYHMDIELGRVYAGTESGSVIVLDIVDGHLNWDSKVVNRTTGERYLDGQKVRLFGLCADLGIVYCGYDTGVVKMWYPERYENPYVVSCMASETIFSELPTPPGYVDRSGEIMALSYESIANAQILIKNKLAKAQDKLKVFHDIVPHYHETLIFYVLRAENWEFLRYWESKYEDLKLRIVPEDYASRKLLINKAISGDEKFFTQLLALKKFEWSDFSRTVLATAIKHNHVWMAKLWTHTNQDLSIIESCFYGRPEWLKQLLTRRNINVHLPDPETGNHPIHICHMPADFSEYNRGRSCFGGNEYRYWDLNIAWNIEKSWVPEDVWSSLESDLVSKRFDCFTILRGLTETTKQPRYTAENKTKRTPYQIALRSHADAIEKMKFPKKEEDESEEIAQRDIIFGKTQKVLEFYETEPHIAAIRFDFARKTCFRESWKYIIYLILLTAVGFLMSTNGQGEVFRMNTAMDGYLLGDSFNGVTDVGTFWEFISNGFIPAVSEHGTILNFNNIIGAIQFRQLRMKNDSCTPRGLYSADSCYNPSYSQSSQSEEPYGPNNQWVYQKDIGDPYWTEINGNTLPRGGYIVNIESEDNATMVIQDLQSNGWVDDSTRYVLISMNVYNGNETGLFAIVRLEFYFSGTGVVMTSSNINVWGPNTYDIDILLGGVIKIILQLIVLGYVIWEFIFQEVYEIYDHLKQAKKINIIRSRAEVESPHYIRMGLRLYMKELWNFYEWATICMFVSIFVMEITVISKLATVNLHPLASEYVDLQSIATIINYEHDLLSLFILLCWLRLLKFLRIPKSTGPTVQSVMDTLTSAPVAVFVFIVLYVVIIFSICFHIAFGPSLVEYSTWNSSIISTFIGLFGGPDYSSFRSSNPIFGPILFVFFMVFTVVLLMNLMIGILSQSYNDAQQINDRLWNRLITRKMIQDLDPSPSVKEIFRPVIRRLANCFPGNRYFILPNDPEEPVNSQASAAPNLLVSRVAALNLQNIAVAAVPNLTMPAPNNTSTPDDKKVQFEFYNDDQLDDFVAGQKMEWFSQKMESGIRALASARAGVQQEEKKEEEEVSEIERLKEENKKLQIENELLKGLIQKQ